MAQKAAPADLMVNSFTSNCFPARPFNRKFNSEDGAWLVEYRKEQNRFEGVLRPRQVPSEPTKSTSYSTVVEKIRLSDLTDTSGLSRPSENATDRSGLLDGFFLLKHCSVEDPSDLSSINISSKQLNQAHEDDFNMFNNVVSINAGDNVLSIESFRQFPALQKLELPLNALRNLQFAENDFPFLEILDLSYNNLSSSDVLALGQLPNLRVLNLSGNQLRTLPLAISSPRSAPVSTSARRSHKQQVATPPASRVAPSLVDDSLAPVDTDAQVLDESLVNQLQSEHHSEAHDDSSPYSREPAKIDRFPRLEVLNLDDNQFEDQNVFVALAALSRLRELNLAGNSLSAVPYMTVRAGEVRVEEDRLKAQRKEARSKRAAAAQKLKTTNQRAGSGEVRAPDAHSSGLALGPTARTGGQATGSHAQAQEQAVQADVREPRASTTKTVRFDDSRIENLEPADESNKHEATRKGKPSDRLEEENPEKPATEAPSTPPFCELQVLNLSNNKINSEKDVIALAGWPMLNQLVLFGNPLIASTAGDPPLLGRLFKQRLAIQLVRKKKELEPQKPGVHIRRDRPDRLYIRAHIPPVPRCDVDKLLAQHLALQQTPVEPTPAIQKEPSVAESEAQQQSPDLREEEIPEPEVQQETGGEEEAPPADDSVFLTQFNEKGGAKAPKNSPASKSPLRPAAAEHVTEEMGLRSGRSEGTSRALAIRVAASIDEPVAEVLQELCAEAAAAARAGRLAARFPPGSQFGPLFRDEHRRVAALATSSGAMGDGDTQRAESQLSAIERRRLEEDIEREIEVVQPGARQQLDVCTEILPKQLPGAVSALKFAVSHPMLLDTDSKLDRFCAVYKGRPKKISDVAGMAREKAQQRRATRVNRALQAVRENRVTVEKPLAEALAEEREKKFQKPEATDLFTNVRKKYKSLRAQSLQHAMESMQSVAEGIDDIRREVHRRVQKLVDESRSQTLLSMSANAAAAHAAADVRSALSPIPSSLTAHSPSHATLGAIPSSSPRHSSAASPSHVSNAAARSNADGNGNRANASPNALAAIGTGLQRASPLRPISTGQLRTSTATGHMSSSGVLN